MVTSSAVFTYFRAFSPVEATVVIDKKGNLEKKQALFVRLNNRTREIIDAEERGKYILSRWDPAQPPRFRRPIGRCGAPLQRPYSHWRNGPQCDRRKFFCEDVWRATS